MTIQRLCAQVDYCCAERAAKARSATLVLLSWLRGVTAGGWGPCHFDWRDNSLAWTAAVDGRAKNVLVPQTK